MLAMEGSDMNSTQSDTSIRDIVFGIVAKQAKLDIGVLTPESTLRGLGVESLTAIEVLFEIEERFDINFTDESMSMDLNSGTLQQLVDAVETALAAKQAKA